MGKSIDTLITVLDSQKLITEISAIEQPYCAEGIADDSRVSGKGYIFICKGADFREEYLNAALDAGACMYISERKYTDRVPYIIVNDIRRAMAAAGRWFYGDPGDSLTKIGVTGTKGKTSCVSILSDIMRSAGIETAEFTTHNIRIGEDTYESALTTPEPLELQRYFREAVDDGMKAVAMEISSQAMKMKRVYHERYRVGVFLNIERDHISPSEHADMDEYLECKVAMFRQCDTVIINRDTAMFDRIIAAVPEGTKVILFGQRSYETFLPDAVIRNVQMDIGGLSFDISYKGSTVDIHTNLIGRFNVENIAAAVLSAMELGVDTDVIRNAVRNIFIPGRLNMLEVCGRHVIIDYAHNHLSYDRLYRTVRSIYPDSRMTVMVGAVGSKAFGRRREAGQVANVYADRVVITEQDSAGESAGKIAMEIARYVRKPYKIVPRREIAIRQILDGSEPGDVIVLTGKGDEKTLRTGQNTIRQYAGDLAIVRMWQKSAERICG